MNSIVMNIHKAKEQARNWCVKNIGWKPICDMEESDSMYQQWEELPKAERMSWIGRYGRDAKSAFEEFAIKRCKTKTGYIGEDGSLHGTMPVGQCGMMVFLVT